MIIKNIVGKGFTILQSSEVLSDLLHFQVKSTFCAGLSKAQKLNPRAVYVVLQASSY